MKKVTVVEDNFARINTKPLKENKKVKKTELQYSVHVAISATMRDHIIKQCKLFSISKEAFIRQLLTESIYINSQTSVKGVADGT